MNNPGDEQKMLDVQTVPLSYSLIQDIGDEVNLTYIDSLEVTKKNPPTFYQRFKNEYFSET